MKLRKRLSRILVNLLLVAASTAVALVLAEILLRVIGLDFSHLQGLDALAIHENLGWVNEPDQRNEVCNRLIRPDCVIVRTNSQSLREDRDTSFPALPGERRFLVLGDSQTAADMVNNDETYSSALEELINWDNDGQRIEVLNGGVRGYSPVQEWLWFREFGAQYSPDLTVWGLYSGNDIIDLGASDNRPYLELQANGEIILRSEHLSSLPAVEGSTSENWRSLGFLTSLKHNLRPFYTYQALRQAANSPALREPLRRIGLLGSQARGTVQTDDEQWQAAVNVCHGCVLQSLSQARYLGPEQLSERYRLLEEVLLRLKQDAESRNSRLVVIVIPTKALVEPEIEPKLALAADLLGTSLEEAIESDTAVHETIVSLCQSNDIEYLDLLPAFAEYRSGHRPQPLFFNLNWHLSPVGHRLVAEQLYDHLQSSGGLER